MLGFPKLRVLSTRPTPNTTSSSAYFVRLAKLYGILANDAGPPAFLINLLLTCCRFKPRRPYHHLPNRGVHSAFPTVTWRPAISHNRNFGANPFNHYGLLTFCLRFTILVPLSFSVRLLRKTRFMAAGFALPKQSFQTARLLAPRGARDLPVTVRDYCNWFIYSDF